MMLRSAVASFVGATLLLIALPAYAQFDTGEGALSISPNPQYPSPNSTVQLTAESPLLDLPNSDIEWTVNGAAAGSGQSIQVSVGPLGSATNVSVSVSGESGDDSAELTLVPTSVDLLWEADSYTPPFYRGRAVPTSGSMIRLFAVPHFVASDGTTVAPSGVDFTWKLNGGVDEAQSGIGESSASFPAAILYGTDVIEVDAQTPDGSLAGSASVAIQTQAPQLVLYEDNPLFGIMYHEALGSSQNAPESETSFAAVPYFADAASPNDASLAYQWSVNGISIPTDPSDPSEITISASSSQQAQIQLSVSKPSDPFFSASGSWLVSFGASAQNGSNNAFNSSQ
jgi:hypothetical protein